MIVIQIKKRGMLNITYNISPKLNEHLSKIEDLRKQILLEPLSPQTELRLRWEAILDRIHYSLKLANNPLKKMDMLKLLSEVKHKNTNDDQREVLQYKEALDYIFQNWQGSQKNVDSEAVIMLHRIIGSGRLRVPQAGLQALLDYLQAEGENPIIQAAIVNIEMEKMQLFTENNSLIARLTANLFLSKYGYDLKGLLAYEAAWMKDEKQFRENHERALNTISLTLWLEYFAQSVLEQMETIIQSIKNSKSGIISSKEAFWELQERQKSILNLLDQPQATITNRQIQKKYKISQITASRDLAKLTNLGCLISHGKGRSVYYTKI
jgi:Fic family protein